MFRNVRIKNATTGIQAQRYNLDGNTQVATNRVTLYNTIIQNSGLNGMVVRNHNIQADNTLIYNAKNTLLTLEGAGKHVFLHNTLANYWPDVRGASSLKMHNAFSFTTLDGKKLDVTGNLDVKMENSIVYGTLGDEINISPASGATLTYDFAYCVLKTTADTLSPQMGGAYDHVIINPSTPEDEILNPLFINPYDNDFALNDSSRAIDKASLILTDTLLFDIIGTSRLPVPDIGAYQWKEKTP